MTVQKTTLEDATEPFFVGVDVGGTSIKIGLIDDRGHSLAFTSFPTADHLGPENAIDRIRLKTDQLLAELGIDLEHVCAMGLGTPGTMDIQGGMILEPPNLPGWRHFPIRDALRTACNDKPVTYANDAGAAAYGEYWVGSGSEFSSIVLLTLGTGVGGGIIVDDQSIDGVHSHGSECGHVIIDSSDSARRCSCGQLGHLEAYASATAVAARTQEVLDTGIDSSINRRIEQGEKLSSLMVAQEAEAGDEVAESIVMQTADYLAIGLVNVAHVIDPGAAILGGAMNFGGPSSSLGRRFLQRIRTGFVERTFPVIASKCVIEFASLAGDAGYIGAAGLARRAWNQK